MPHWQCAAVPSEEGPAGQVAAARPGPSAQAFAEFRRAWYESNTFKQKVHAEVPLYLWLHSLWWWQQQQRQQPSVSTCTTRYQRPKVTNAVYMHVSPLCAQRGLTD